MKKNIEFALVYKGKPTLWGVYQWYQDDFHKNWKANSTQENALINIRKICSMIRNHDRMSVDMYTRKDFEKLINRISQKGKFSGKVFVAYKQKTIDRYRFIIEKLIEVAASYGECENIFENQLRAETRNAVKKEKHVRKKIVKSLSVRQVILLHMKLSNFRQSGKRMCLWLMYCKGLRNSESAGADFEDIKPMDSHPGCYELWVYRTSERNSNKRKGSGKNVNADRILPLTDYEYNFLMKRKAYVVSELIKMGVENPETIIDKLPIGCADSNFFTPLSSNDISKEGRTLFNEIKIEREMINQLEEDLRDAVMHNHEEIDPIEDDITSYTLRRMYATVLEILSFGRDQISYILGHDIPGSGFVRNDFRYSELRMTIKNRMELRPLTGSYNPSLGIEIKSAKTIKIERAGDFLVSANNNTIHLHLAGNFQNDEIKIIVENSSNAVKTNVFAIKSFMEEKDASEKDISEKNVDVINMYHQKYAEEIEYLHGLNKG